MNIQPEICEDCGTEIIYACQVCAAPARQTQMEALLKENERLETRYRKLAGALSYEKDGRTIDIAAHMELLEKVVEAAKEYMDRHGKPYETAARRMLRKTLAALKGQT